MVLAWDSTGTELVIPVVTCVITSTYETPLCPITAIALCMVTYGHCIGVHAARKAKLKGQCWRAAGYPGRFHGSARVKPRAQSKSA